VGEPGQGRRNLRREKRILKENKLKVKRKRRFKKIFSLTEVGVRVKKNQNVVVYGPGGGKEFDYVQKNRCV